MARTALLLALLLFAACLLLPQQAPPDAPPTFRGESTLALVPFSAIRGEYFALNLKAEEILLFEDGKPREFTIFEGHGTGRRPPLELVLLFDTTTFPPPESKIGVENTYWDREATYAFTKDWSDKESRAVLEKNGADVRVAVYRPGLSGGSLFPPKLDAESIDQALEIIRNEGLSQYVVGFAPPQSGQQKQHKLEVRLKDKNSAKLRGGQRTVAY